MSNKLGENTYTICYNGQLYNAKELKQILLENGFDFEGHCDTEILLKAFIHYGYDVVHHLNGIFSFAIWNENKQELFMARDHFGIKPFYYSIFDDNFIFSSEVKAILKFPSFPTIISGQGISELIGLRSSTHSTEQQYLIVFLNCSLRILLFIIMMDFIVKDIGNYILKHTKMILIPHVIK